MEVNIKKEGLETIIEISGSITSANAPELEAAVKDIQIDEGGISVDARNLDFISSAGLRIILSLKKKCGSKHFSVINVNNDVKNVFDVTGFSDIMEIVKAPRKISVEGCEVIGRGACGECFRIDDETIVKLYYPRITKEEIEREKALAKKAFVLGVPTAISFDVVECDGRTGVIYEFIKSKTLTELIRDDEVNLEKYIKMYVDVCKSIHTAEDSDNSLPSFKELTFVDIDKMGINATDEEKDMLKKFLDAVPDTNNCVHGDLNYNNIMVNNGECCIIDMGEFSRGTPLFDVSRFVFSVYYAKTVDENGINQFYKLKQSLLEESYDIFMKLYYGSTDIDEISKTYPNAKWIFPMAQFRAVTSFLKEKSHWEPGKDILGRKIFDEMLKPFIEKEVLHK